MKSVVAMLSAALVLGLVGMTTEASAGGDGFGPGYGGKGRDCFKCPKPRPHYDSTEVIKDVKEIDKSQVIETQSVVPSKRLIEINHLIIRENELRKTGVVQHNHTIIEKELVLTKRNVDTKVVNKVVDLVEHKFNTERKRVVEEREVPGENRDITCLCPEKDVRRDKDFVPPEKHRPVNVYGQARPVNAYARAPKYVSSRH
jgi:hypothetical protein